MNAVQYFMELDAIKMGYLKTGYNILLKKLMQNTSAKTFVKGIFGEDTAAESMFRYCISRFERDTDNDFFGWLELYDSVYEDGKLMKLLAEHGQL